MPNIVFKATQVVYKRMVRNEEVRVPHSDCVCFKPIAISNTLDEV